MRGFQTPSKSLELVLLSICLLISPITAFATPLPPKRLAVAQQTPFRPAPVTFTSTQLDAFPRGGAATPQAFFIKTLIALGVTAAVAKLSQQQTVTKITPATQQLQRRFLPVFWILRCADWLQGPYFYSVYNEKCSISWVSRLFLTGFASTAAFGPSVGRAADAYGRKRATLAFCLLYSLGALSTQSSVLKVLFVGRILSGIGTSLLFSAPEAWMVGEAQRVDAQVGETFGLAYAGDSVVAIIAGQLAALAASRRGSTGPFELSTAFLVLGGLLASVLWKENKAESINQEGPSIREAVQVVLKDPKIMMVGATQSLFEAAMYIFVLQWPPAMTAAIESAFGKASTPFGTIFSCFMACCLLGSTLFSQMTKSISVENFTTGMMAAGTLAMTGAAALVSSTPSLAGLVAAFFCFEACVGMYFPSIGTLRSKYVPDSHRSVIMNLFGIPLNVLVVSVFLSIEKLGVSGALSVSSAALGLGTFCMLRLRTLISKDKESG